MTTGRRYVLVTAACNEGKYIENTIRAVVAQKCAPDKWIIVSDNSTDDTDAIVQSYAAKHTFLRLLRLTEEHPRNFAAQANAINAGISQLTSVPYDYIGNLDADITFEPSYFCSLMDEFERDPKLGIAGGDIREMCADGVFRSRPTNKSTSVAHAVQLFRRECFESIGAAYPALPYGGPDTYAEITARMNGWRVASIQHLGICHHRPTSSAGGRLRGCFRQGRMDYSLGIKPTFEIFKLLKRVPTRPYFLGSVSRGAGFVWCYLRKEPRAVSPSFIKYFRQEQTDALRNLFARTEK